jgi:hypothetical protein
MTISLIYCYQQYLLASFGDPVPFVILLPLAGFSHGLVVAVCTGGVGEGLTFLGEVS